MVNQLSFRRWEMKFKFMIARDFWPGQRLAQNIFTVPDGSHRRVCAFGAIME